MTKIAPLVGEPVIKVENSIKVLVIADIHLGIERDLHRSGINIPSQTDKLLKRILEHIRSTRPERIVLLGDVKHNIPGSSWQEKNEIPEFLEELSEYAQIEITTGNHDGNIDLLIPESRGISLHGPRGFVLDGVGYFHGHAWPAPDLFSADFMLMGHTHPVVKLRDSLGYVTTFPVFIRAGFDEGKLTAHYGEIKYSNPLLVVLPAFNKLCGGLSVNDKSANLLGPIFTSKTVEMSSADLYLIDGTYIGNISTLKC
ncbi:MAG: metallophosphoesterase [Halobacteriota archaeon]|nr:metallophosphoesterase [Halobacteriota archaeon]